MRGIIPLKVVSAVMTAGNPDVLSPTPASPCAGEIKSVFVEAERWTAIPGQCV